MTSKMLLHRTPTQQVPRTGFACRPQGKPLPLGHRLIAHAEEGKGAKGAKEGGEKSAKAAKSGDDKGAKAAKASDDKGAKSGGESKPAKSGGGGKDKFVGEYKSGEKRDKRQTMLASSQSLSYLDGSLAGDYAFDPLGLMDPEGAGDEGFISPPWLVYGEIYNGRWAMLGVVGCLFPEVLAYFGVIPQSVEEMTWFRSGVYPPAGTRTYWADPYTLFFVELWLFNIVELRRLRDYRNPGSMSKQFFLGAEKGLGGSGDPSYPGGLFNPLGLGEKDPEGMHTYKVREVKNGRLAMIAMLGFAGQGTLTNKGPFTNLVEHISDPGNNNIYRTLSKLYEPLS